MAIATETNSNWLVTTNTPMQSTVGTHTVKKGYRLSRLGTGKSVTLFTVHRSSERRVAQKIRCSRDALSKEQNYLNQTFCLGTHRQGIVESYPELTHMAVRPVSTFFMTFQTGLITFFPVQTNIQECVKLVFILSGSEKLCVSAYQSSSFCLLNHVTYHHIYMLEDKINDSILFYSIYFPILLK